MVDPTARTASGGPDETERGPSDGVAISALVDTVSDYAIFLLDRDGVVTSWNAGAQRLKGYRPDEIVGRHFSAFYLPADVARGKPARALAEARRAGRVEDEGWRLRKDGTRFWASVVITAVNGPDGSLMGYGKVTRDLTERKQSEDALRGALELERAAGRRLRDLDQLRSDVVAIVAHDLDAPVRTARGLTSALLQDWATTTEGERRDIVERIDRRLDSLAGLVNQVLDLARIEARALTLEVEVVDVVELVRRVTDDVVDGDARPRVMIDLPDDLPPVCVDERRTWQVLANLVSNALKFSGDEPVAIRATVEGDHVVVSVLDHGPGISAADQDLLFQRFSRLPEGQERAPGVGIGLFMARAFTEAQGGVLRIVSRIGEGSTFSATLPVARDQP